MILIAALLVRGIGLGVVTTPLMTVGFRGLPGPQVPDASIISRVSQQLGGSFGGAVLTVILASSLTAATASGTDAALAGAFHHSFWWASAFTALGVVMSFLLPSTLAAAKGPRSSGPPPSPAEAAPSQPQP